MSAKLIGAALLVLVPMPALAAGHEAWSLGMALVMFVVFMVVFGLPATGWGFFLQGFMRLRNAIAVTLALALLGLAVIVYPRADRLVDAATLAALFLLGLSPLFGLGWYLGIIDTRRRALRRGLA